MAIKVPDGGELILLGYIQQTFNGAAFVSLRLFVNNHTPADADTSGNYTEATFPGYAAVHVNAWGGPATNGDGDAQIDEVSHTFTCIGGGSLENVYGYYVTDPAGNLIYAERDPQAPTPMVNNLDDFVVIPKLTLRVRP